MAVDTNLDVQYRAVRESCGLWRRPDSVSVQLQGEDRARLLNGLVTCDVSSLTMGRGAQGFFTDVKGHVLAEVVVRARGDDLLLELPAPVADRIAAHVEKYVVADRVEVGSPVRHHVVTLLGPQSADRVAALLPDTPVPAGRWSHCEIELGERPALVTVDAHFGVLAFSVWSAAPEVAGWVEALLTQDDEIVPMAVCAEVVETVRIEEGVPLFGRDYDSDNLPQESGLETAVDYDKGCFLGQEVVARLQYRGQVARRVVRLRGALDPLPEAGSRLLLEGREAGFLTSITRRPGGNETSALAMLQRRAFDPGNELQLDDGQTMSTL